MRSSGGSRHERRGAHPGGEAKAQSHRIDRTAPSSRLVLDTSAYSHLRAGHPETLDCVAAAEAILLPTIVLGELDAGFRLGARLEENRVVLREFLAEPFVSVLPVTADVALRYAEVFASLRRAGTPIPINDIWIAATALDAGAHLVTFDSDFKRVPSLNLISLCA